MAPFALKQGRSTDHFYNGSVMIRLVGRRVRGENRPLWEKGMLRLVGKTYVVFTYAIYDVRSQRARDFRRTEV